MNMRIVITHPHSLHTPGGGSLHCRRLAASLVRLGADVVLVPAMRGPAAGEELLPARVVGAAPSRLHYLFDGRGVLRTVMQVCRAEPVDAVLGWATEAAFLPGPVRGEHTLFGMVAGSPYGLWMRGGVLRTLKRPVDSFFRGRPLRRADVVFAVSQYTRQELLDVFRLDPARIVVTHLGVDPEFGAAPRPPARELTRLIFFGALLPLKGIFDLVRSLGPLASRPWSLKVAGWGDTDGVRRAAAEQGIAERVTLLGPLQRSRLIDELADAQLAILPSYAESFGLALAEAQASGLPVIAYRAGAVPEVVEDGVTGWLVQTGRVDLLTTAIGRAMDEPSRAHEMGLAARERIYRLFSWERAASTVLRALADRRRETPVREVRP